MPRKKAEPKTAAKKEAPVEIRQKLREQTVAYITAAFGLVAGLAWNEAIKSAIESFFIFNSDTIWAKFIYAIIITIVLVLVTIYLNHLFKIDATKKKDDKK